MTSKTPQSPWGIGFPGQGHHDHEQMGRLVRNFPEVADLIQEGEDRLRRPLFHLLLDPSNSEQTSRDKQVRLYLGSASLWLVALKEKIVPANIKRYFFGSSAGELTAVMAAGKCTFATGLELIDDRGDEMHKAGIARPGRMMAASGLHFEEAEEIAEMFPEVEAVNQNPGMQSVFSGAKEAVDGVAQYLTDTDRWSSVRIYNLDEVLEAAHTWRMRPAAKGWGRPLRRANMKRTKDAFMGNQAKIIRSVRGTKKHLKAQLTRRVLLAKSADRLYGDYGVRTFVDVGQGDILYAQLLRHFRNADDPVKVISVVNELFPEDRKKRKISK